jgi:hypothetical protein
MDEDVTTDCIAKPGQSAGDREDTLASHHGAVGRRDDGGGGGQGGGGPETTRVALAWQASAAWW